ncbi:retrovirus-related pol polyprotein from transposon TNT 1-94 [Tanacetum coccineum]
MLIYTKAPLFLWAEVVATACYTQNRSIVRLRHGKTPYELLHDKLPDLSFFHVFGALCYPTNDSENLGKLQPKADIGIFIGYAPTKKAFRIYNRRTRRIIETIHIDFDELTVIASKHNSSGSVLHEMTLVTISSGLIPNPPPSTPFIPPSRSDWDLLFQPLFDELLTPPPSVDCPTPEVIAPIAEVVTSERTCELKTYKDALTQSCWIEEMQEELNEFERLEVRELVPRPDKVMVISLKWIIQDSKPDLTFAVACVEAYADADHAGYQDTTRSTSGTIMDTTKGTSKGAGMMLLLVAPENHLKIGKCNQRLSPTLKSNEPTIQVELDALKLTPFYNAFEVSADVPKNFTCKNMLKICPKLLCQKFEDPPFEEEILSFIRDLRHTGEIKIGCGREYDEQDDDNQDDDDQEHDGQEDEEQGDVNNQTDSDNDGDDFVHPKLSTHDEMIKKKRIQI